MKSYFIISSIAVSALASMIFGLQKSTAADIAGEWTKCIAVSQNTKYNIVNGQGSKEICRSKAVECTQNPNVTTTYHSSPVIINAPYQRCTN